MRTAETGERQCWGCRAEVETLVCARCQAIQPLSGEPDLFAVLGLPRRLMIDPADLERRYHETSRVVHPDRFQTARDRKSTRLNSSHRCISYAVFCLKKKTAT